MTPWSAHYYTHPNSYYPVEPSATGQLVLVENVGWELGFGTPLHDPHERKLSSLSIKI